MVSKPTRTPSRCTNCGVTLMFINVGTPQEPEFRQVHPRGFKKACDLLAQRRREQRYRYAGQMFYDPVLRQFEWMALNGV